MRRTVCLIACLSLFVFSGVFVTCSDDDSPTQPPPLPTKSVICPLAVGNVWNYVDSVWVGGAPGAFGSTIEITGDTMITVGHADYDVFYWDVYDSLNNELTTLLVANERDGFWELGIECSQDTLPIFNLAAAYPTAVDSTWTKSWYMCGMGRPIGLSMGTARCVSVDSLVQTPAGAFWCHVYHEQYSSPFGPYDIYTYYSPNVGLIASQVQGAGNTWKRMLNRYTLK